MKKQTYFIIVLQAVLFAHFAWAQQPAFMHYETSNGLPSNEVYDIRQDKQGFLWLGTDAGLVRYDGNSFIAYTNKQSRGTSISCLREDKQGRIWCTNFSGQIFYMSSDSLALFIPFEKRYQTQYAEIDFDANGDLIVTNAVNYIYRYNINTKKEETIGESNSYYYPYKMFNNEFVFCKQSLPVELMRLNGNMQQQIPFIFENNIKKENYFFNRFILTNTYKNKQTLCFQSFNLTNPLPLLFYFDKQSRCMLVHPVSKILQTLNTYPQSVYDDDDGNLWVGTKKQLLWFKKDGNMHWQLFTTLFSDNSISCITKDREGSIWVSTLKNGIFKIPNTQVYTLNTTAKSVGINHLATDGNKSIYYSHLSGEVFEFDTKNKRVIPYSTPEERDVQSLAYNAFTKELYITKNASFIVNTSTTKMLPATIHFYNCKNIAFTKGEIYFKTGPVLEAIFKAEDKLAHQTLLAGYDTIYKPYYFANSDKDQLGWHRLIIKEQRCKSVCYDEKDNTLWVGFVDGLVYFKNHQQHNITEPNTNRPIIATQIIYDQLHQLVYVSTSNQGLFVIKDDKIIQHIQTQNGLYSNNIKGFRIYKNEIWLVANSKVQCYNIETSAIKTIDMQDGLLSNELYDVELLNDTVYIASSKGLQYFPANIQTYNNIPPVSIIESFTADDSLYHTAKAIVLKAFTKNISIQLQGIALKSNGSMQFQYRLLPNDSNWITVNANQNIVRYTLLSAGEYSFESRVINEDGLASTMNSTQRFIIPKPWYWQSWFILFIALSILFIGYLFYKYRLNLQQEKFAFQLESANVQEALRKSQLASLKSQMNPHFMFNALNSIQEFIILNDKQKANMYMGKFADLMRMTLDMSNKDEVSLHDELKSLNLYLELEALRFEDSFSYTLHVDDKINTEDIYLPSMLIQPYIENAVKHGLLHKTTDRKMEISFSLSQPDMLNCIIKDNGIGRKRSGEINALRLKKHTSFATGATQNRLDLLNFKKGESISVQYNDLYDSMQNSLGTEVRINIPV